MCRLILFRFVRFILCILLRAAYLTEYFSIMVMWVEVLGWQTGGGGHYPYITYTLKSKTGTLDLEHLCDVISYLFLVNLAKLEVPRGVGHWGVLWSWKIWLLVAKLRWKLSWLYRNIRFNSNSILELMRELELKDLEQNEFKFKYFVLNRNWNWKI